MSIKTITFSTATFYIIFLTTGVVMDLNYYLFLSLLVVVTLTLKTKQSGSIPITKHKTFTPHSNADQLHTDSVDHGRRTHSH